MRLRRIWDDSRQLAAVKPLPFRRGLPADELKSFHPSLIRGFTEPPFFGTGEEAFVFASHENSITLTGEWLTEAFRKAVPNCEDSTYLGQLSTPDLRGRW